MTARRTSRCLQYPEIRDRLIYLDGCVEDLCDDRLAARLVGLAEARSTTTPASLPSTAHSCVNAATQWAGIAALNGPQDGVREMVAEFDRRRKIVVEGLNRLSGVSCITPKGAFYAFPNVSRTGWKAKALASTLLEEAGVATIGGPDFGVHGEGYMRLSYANSAENIRRALERMGEFLETRKAA